MGWPRQVGSLVTRLGSSCAAPQPACRFVYMAHEAIGNFFAFLNDYSTLRASLMSSQQIVSFQILLIVQHDEEREVRWQQ